MCVCCGGGGGVCARLCVHVYNRAETIISVIFQLIKKRDSQKHFCDATHDATVAKPGNPQIATISQATQLPQLGHRRSLAQLNFCDATNNLAYDFDLFYSKVVQRFKSCPTTCTSCTKPSENHGDVPACIDCRAKSARQMNPIENV